MRCPKCGYNSFDHLDSCKKCGKELLEYKQRYGIKSVLYPGLMKPGPSTGGEADSGLVDAAVAAAAVTVAGSAGGGFAAESGGTETAGSEADDFGFDFMGESEEEDDLSFDELFEEAPVDEDVEEALPSPSAAGAVEKETTEFSFASAAADVAAGRTAVAESDLENDFGFDLDAPDPLTSGAGPTDDLEADDFELPPVVDEGFDFNPDDVEFEESEEEAETKGDPKDPFELPESSQVEEAPEQQHNFTTDQILSTSAEEVPGSDHEFERADVAEPESAELLNLFHDPFAEDDALPLTAVDESLAAALADEAGRTDELVAETPPQVIIEAELAPLGGSDAALLTEPATASDAWLAITGDEQSGSGRLPPVASRIGAFCCDLALLSAVAGSFIVAAEAAMSGSSDRLLPSLTTLIDLSVPYFLVLFSLAFGYFTLFHFLVGQTPGKMLTGLRVETLAGEPLVLSQAFLRSVGGLLQLLPVGLGYLIALFSPDQRGWNDRLAGTRLISLKADLKA